MGDYSSWPGPCASETVPLDFSSCVFTFFSEYSQTEEGSSLTGVVSTTSSFTFDPTGTIPGTFRIIKSGCCVDGWDLQLVPTSTGDYPSNGTQTGNYNSGGSGPCIAVCNYECTDVCDSAIINEAGNYGYQVGASSTMCSSTGGSFPNQCAADAAIGLIPSMSGSSSPIPYSAIKGTHTFTQSGSGTEGDINYSYNRTLTVVIS